MFRERRPSIFITPHKMPRLPWDFHLVTTESSPDIAIRKKTQHDTSEVLRLPRKMTMEVSKALLLPRQMQRIILGKRCKSNAPDTQNDFRHVLKHVGTSRSATRCLIPPKATAFAERAIRPCCPHDGRSRTVGSGCEHRSSVERTRPHRRAQNPPAPKVLYKL